MIRHIREKLGMTQRELASALNTTQGAVSHIEIGRTSLRKDFADSLISLCSMRGIKITYDDIYRGEVSHSQRSAGRI